MGFQLTRAWEWCLQTTCFIICCIVNGAEFVSLSNFKDPDTGESFQQYEFSQYFVKNQLLTANLVKTLTTIVTSIQIVLYTVHLSLLFVAKRTLMCRDLGEQDVAPGFDVDQEANPLNR